MRKRVLIFCCALLALFAGRAFGQEADDAPNPQREADEQYERIENADPHAPQYALRWLSQAIVHANDPRSTSKTLAAVATAREYRLEEAGPDLVSLYRVTEPRSVVRDDIALAVLAIRSPASRRFLKELRADSTLPAHSHVFVLAALVNLGDESARDELMKLIPRWIAAINQPAPDDETRSIPFALRNLSDEKIAAEIERLRDLPANADKRRTIQFTLYDVQMNALPADKLFAEIEGSLKTNDELKCIAAITAFSRKASLDDAKKLYEIPIGAQPGTRISGFRPTFHFSQLREDTVRDIRRWHWRELSEAPTTQSMK